MDHNDYIENENDHVLEEWGLPVNTRGHVPFYRQLYFPDVYELRQCGYDIRRFEELFDLLENAKISHARKVHSLLHVEFASTIFDPNIAKRAGQIEDRKRFEPLTLIPAMAEIAAGMVHDVLTAYAARDPAPEVEAPDIEPAIIAALEEMLADTDCLQVLADKVVDRDN